MSSPTRKPGIHIAWKTVTYRSVALMIIGGFAVVLIGIRLTFPQFTESSIKAAGSVADKALERVAGMAPAAGHGVSTAQQAHFTALDGTVRVKKGNGNSWVGADYNIPLEKGDVVQTGSEGMAKVVFNDGTSYTVKQDSLIVIEENSANDQQQTNVAVAVSTGTVDLSTATYSQGSKSQVIVAGATASLAPESAARVHNDPKADRARDPDEEGRGRGYAKWRNGATGQLGTSKLPGSTATHGERQRDGTADADFSGEYGADLHFRGNNQGRGIFLDLHGERNWLPAADLEEPVLFLDPGRQESEHCGCYGYKPGRRSLLLGSTVV